ncbi:putative ATP-dependent helicase IRC3, partial [Massospora cicadina]
MLRRNQISKLVGWQKGLIFTDPTLLWRLRCKHPLRWIHAGVCGMKVHKEQPCEIKGFQLFSIESKEENDVNKTDEGGSTKVKNKRAKKTTKATTTTGKKKARSSAKAKATSNLRGEEIKKADLELNKAPRDLSEPSDDYTASDDTASVPNFNTLRPYQQDCIDATLENFKKGINRQVVSLPVGAGKTVIMSHLIPLVPSPTPEATKTLVLAHRQELLFQAAKKISSVCPSLRVEVERGTLYCDLENVDVLVASVQSLGRKGSPRLRRFDPNRFKLIIIDEAHHAAATTYSNILKHFGLFKPPSRSFELILVREADESNCMSSEKASEAAKIEKINDKIFLWGCSATLRRHDGVGLSSVFDFISYHKDFFDMVREKWLCDLQVTTIKTEVDLSQVKCSGDDFVLSRLAQAVDTPLRNELVVHTFNRLAAGRKSTLVFAADVKHVDNLAAAFRKLGHTPVTITSDTPTDLRIFYLDQFRHHKISILINCLILTEGLDIPSVDCIVMARPTRSMPLYQQMLGRGMRQFPGKENCLILDFVDILKDKTLCTVPTLLGLECDFDFHGESLSKAIKDPNKKLPKAPEPIPEPVPPPAIQAIKLKQYNTIHELGQQKPPLNIPFRTHLEWVYIRNGVYALSANVGTIRVEEKDGSFTAVFRRKFTSRQSHFNYAKLLHLPIEADSLEMAIRGAETFLASKYPDSIAVARRHSRWRSEPITPGQVGLLTRILKLPELGTSNSFNDAGLLSQLTRGEATNIITLYMEGGLLAIEAAKPKKVKVKEAIKVDGAISVSQLEHYVTTLATRPDYLAPADFFLFPKLKVALKGKRFDN